MQLRSRVYTPTISRPTSYKKLEPNIREVLSESYVLASITFTHSHTSGQCGEPLGAVQGGVRHEREKRRGRKREKRRGERKKKKICQVEPVQVIFAFFVLVVSQLVV